MSVAPETAGEYIASLPDERRAFVAGLRDVILRNLDDGFEETIEFGMLAYCVPLETFPDTYNGRPLMYAALASHKQYVSLYLMGVYGNDDTAAWFRDEYQKTGKRLNMGKSCVRFRKEADIPYDLIAQAITLETAGSYLEKYQKVRTATGRK